MTNIKIFIMKLIKLSFIGVITLLGISCISCGNKDHKPTAEETMAAEEGAAAAREVKATSPGSMQREKAILKIRATEEKILQSGDTLAARAYAKAAEAVLDSII